MGVDTITEVRQYLTFKLSEEVYALDVAKVRSLTTTNHVFLYEI